MAIISKRHWKKNSVGLTQTFNNHFYEYVISFTDLKKRFEIIFKDSVNKSIEFQAVFDSGVLVQLSHCTVLSIHFCSLF